MARHRDDEDEAEETLLVDREAEAETIVVDRESAEITVTADREAAEETLVVDREESTVVVDRGERADATVAVTRERAAKPPTGGALPTSGRRRRGMTMPPVVSGFGRGAVDAVGPGAVSTYEPRPLPGPPPASLDLGGVAATRVDAPGMPSVERRSRRTGMIALGAFALACVVSVVGLIALGIAVLG